MVSAFYLLFNTLSDFQTSFYNIARKRIIAYKLKMMDNQTYFTLFARI